MDIDKKFGELEAKYRIKHDDLKTQLNQIHGMVKNLIMFCQDMGMKTSAIISELTEKGITTESEILKKWDEAKGYTLTEEPISEKDLVWIDMKATIGTEAFEEKDLPVQIGLNYFPFENSLLGARAGETVTTTLKWENERNFPQWNGKDVNFTLDILRVKTLINKNNVKVVKSNKKVHDISSMTPNKDQINEMMNKNEIDRRL